MFTAAMMMYAAASACIGATPAAYAADVMPQSVSGFGLGIYRCAGDIGKLTFHPRNASRELCIVAVPCACLDFTGRLTWQMLVWFRRWGRWW